MPKVLIVFGMGMERSAAPPSCRAITGGPGFARARAALMQELANCGPDLPDLVLSAGTCGALRKEFALGDVFSISRVESDLGSFETSALAGTIASRIVGRSAVLRSQDRVAATRAEKAALAAQGADLVEMEAAAVAEICRKKSIPFSAVKAVSDLADEDLPMDFNRYRAADGGFHNARIAIAGIMKIRGLMRVQRQSRFAVEKLGEALAHLF